LCKNQFLQDGWSGKNCDEPVCGNGCGHGKCVAPDICR